MRCRPDTCLDTTSNVPIVATELSIAAMSYCVKKRTDLTCDILHKSIDLLEQWMEDNETDKMLQE